MTIEEKLVHFQKKAVESARLQSNSVIDEYTAGLESIFEDFRMEKDRQAHLLIQTETDRLTQEANRQLHEEQLQIKREFTKYTGELKEKLFTDVANMLEEFMQTPDYEAWLVKRIKEAKEFARGEEIVIYIDPADSQRLLHLQEQTHTQLSVSKYSFFGGVRAVIPGRHILIDNSFETKLREEKENFTFRGITNGK